MRRAERGADAGTDLIKTIEIKNKAGDVVETKEVVTAKGLLHLAHRERLAHVRTRLLQFPTKENGETAIVTARVVTSRGTFSAIGDANPRNVNARIAAAFIRMAETRALARALRVALDIGAVAIEELEDELTFDDARHDRRSAAAAIVSENGDRPRAPQARTDAPRGPGRDSDAMSDAQKRLLYRIAFEQGHEGDAARTWLHTQLGVESLTEVSKRAASQLIDRFRSTDGANGQQAAE